MNLSSILVFDTRPDYRSIIQQWIAGYWPECRVLHAGSLEEGMKAVESESIDIALIGMPESGLDALAFCRMLKTKKPPPNFPLLLIASHPISSSYHADALEAGVNDCISQPIDQIDLIAKIKTMIRLKRLEDQLRQANDILGKLADERLQSLRHSDIKYRALIDATQDCAWELNLEGVLVDVSPQIQKILGYSAEEMIGTKSFDYVADEDRQRLYELFLSNLADPKPLRNFEITAVHKDGHTVILDLNACPQFSSEGRLIGFLGMNRDISEQKRAEIRLCQNEKRLIESNQILAAVLEHTHVMAVFLDPQFNFIWVNRAYAETRGHEPSFFPGKNHFDLYPHEENLSIFQRVVNTGESFFAMEKPLEFPDRPERGVTYWDWSLIPVKDAMGNVTGLVFTLLDVTSRVQMTEKIHLQSLVLDQIQDQITITDLNGVITYINQEQVKKLGHTQQELVGQTTAVYGENLNRGASQREILEKTLQNGSWRGEVVNYTADGREIILDCRTQVVRNPHGTPVALCGIATDITERKRYEEALRLSEENLQSLFDAIQESVFLMSRDGTLLSANEIFAERLGKTTTECIGRSVYDLIPREVAARRKQIIEWVLHHRQPLTFEDERQGRWFFHSINPVLDLQGKVERIAVFTLDITERKKFEDALRESEERLRLARLATNDVIWDRDIASDTQLWNEAGAVIFGWTDIVQEPQTADWWLERVHPDDRRRVHEGFFAVVDNPDSFRWEDEYQFLKADGSYAQVLDRGYVLRDRQGKAVRMIGAMLNISERKKMEEALRESENRFRVIFEQAYDPICLVDPESARIVEFNEQMCRSSGYTREELSRLTIHDIEALESPEQAGKRLADIVREGKSSFLTQCRTRSGEIRDTFISSSIATFHDRSYVIVILHDVTEQKKAEQNLLRFTRLMESLHSVQAMYIAEKDSKMVFSRLLQILVSLSDSEYGFLDEVVRDDQGELYKKSLAISDIAWDDESRRLYTDLTQSNMEFRNLRNLAGAPVATGKLVISNDPSRDARSGGLPSGHPPIRSFMGIPLYFVGELLGVAGIANRPGGYDEELACFLEPYFSVCSSIIHAIRSRKIEKQIMVALRESSLQLQTIAQAGNVGLWDWDFRTNKVYYSPQWKRQIGYEDTEISNGIEEWQSRVHPDDLNRATKIVQDFIKNPRQGYQNEFRFRHKDGSYRWILAQASLLFDDRGSPVRMLGVHLDITERKREEEERENLQAQLLQAQKLDALGTLAGGIAHDFNNILAGIIGFTQLTMSLCEQETEKYENLKIVLQAAYRAKYLVDQILTFSRKNVLEKKPFLLSSLLKEGLKLMRSTLPSTIEIRQSIEETGLCILGDPNQIYQVLMNLCTNAAHAMREKGGVLSVGLRVELVDSSTPILPIFECTPGQYLCLEVRDTGHGIDPSIHERIFDPFFTTKEKTEGTGLGLSVVLGIVKSHNGAMAMESRVGQGTAFRIFLPTVEFSVDEPQDLSVAPRGQGERILLVDDEEVLIQAGSRILKSLGYEAIPCRDGLEALFLFRTDPSQIDLVLTDQTMPKLKGIELAKEIKALRSDIPILLCTGYDERLTPHQLSEAGICELLMKPFTAQELSVTLRKYFDKRKEG